MKKIALAGTVVAALSFTAFLAGCSEDKAPEQSGSTGQTAAPQAPPAPSGGSINLAFVTNNPSDYWTICRKGTEAAAKELGDVNVQFVMPDDGTAATQKRDVDDLIAKGVKGIAISPVDPTNETPYLNDVAGKTNLITSDSDAASSKRLCYIGTDNRAAGAMAGGLIKDALPQGGKIVLFVGKRDAQNAKDREQGIRDALKGTKVEILDVRTDDTDHARAKANAADALVKYPDVAGLVGLWSYNTPAIVSAVQDAGKTGKVKIVGFDQEDGTINGLKSGAVFGTVVQQPYQFGYQSVKLLEQLAKGDRSGLPKNGLVIVPTQAIKPDGVAAYVAEQNKLLGKS
jgi:ribose transport system substrate-binding protein